MKLFLKRLWCPSLFAFMFTFFVGVPFMVFGGNPGEFNLGSFDVIVVLMALFTLAGALSSFALSFVDKKIRPSILYWINVANIILWIQSTLFVRKGVLDGTAGSRPPVDALAFIELGIFLALLAAAFFLRKKVGKAIVKWAPLALLFAQVFNLAAMAFIADGQAFTKSHSAKIQNDDCLEQFSPKSNIVYFLVDSLRSDVASSLLEEEELRTQFQDFTFYEDALGTCPTTAGAVPSILTGKFYLNNESIGTFTKREYSKSSIISELDAQGYRIETYNALLHTRPDQIDNICPWRLRDAAEPMKTIFKTALYRMVPTLAKIATFDLLVQSGMSVYFYRDIRLFERLRSSFLSIDGKPVFKFIHLRGPHPPFILDENFKFVDFQYSTRAYRNHAKGYLRQIGHVISRMKELGIYDSSTIVVSGDHGIPLPYFNKSDETWVNAMGVDMPAIMIKESGSKGALRRNRDRVSLAGLARSIMQAAGLTTSLPGPSFREAGAKPPQSRHYYGYNWTDDYWASRGLPPLTEFEVSGSASDPNSWKKTGRVLIWRETESLADLSGKKISFDLADKEADSFLISGFTELEGRYRWTATKKAIVVLPMRAGVTALELDIHALFIEGATVRQRVILFFNDIKGEELSLTKEGLYRVAIPKQVLASESLKIVMELPDAISPAQCGINGNDLRELALVIKSIALIIPNVVPIPKAPDGIVFSDVAAARPFLLEGWCGNEGAITWTNGEQALVRFLADRLPRSMSILASPLLGKGLSRQRVQIVVNGREIGSFECVQMRQKVDIAIPDGIVEKGKVLNIAFKLPDAAIPKSLGLNEDTRTLALAFLVIDFRY